MSVLIKGMEMPKGCAFCRFNGADYCYAKGDEDTHSIMPCPLVPVPPHSIDADALITLIQEEKIEGKILDIIKALGDGLQAETLNQACDRHIKIINSLPAIDA